MVAPRSPRSARTVLVIDADLAEPSWRRQLERVFHVVRVASLAGASVAIEGRDVTAIVIVLAPGEVSARILVLALRRHPLLEQTPVFVVTEEVAMLGADLCGLADIQTIEPSQAEYHLCLQIGASAPRFSSRPAPRRSSSLSDPGFLSHMPPPLVFENHRLTARFQQDCAARAERGLALCERLSQRPLLPADRPKAVEELRVLLVLSRTDAELVQLHELHEVLDLAVRVVARFGISRSQTMVPRGVVGLLSSLREFARHPDALQRFDADLHRGRLVSALEPGNEKTSDE